MSVARAAPPADLSSLLLRTALEADFPALPLIWRRSMLSACVIRPEGFDAGFSLPARLRGALGHALIDRARKDDGEAEAARRVLFGLHPAWRPGTQLPKPFVLSADEAGRHLDLKITLFGFADRWRDAVFDAFLEGLSRGVAVSTDDGAPRRRIEIVDAAWTREEQIEIPSLGGSARLAFRTPFRIGPRHALGTRYGDIVLSLVERAAGLAYWQGVRIAPRLSEWRALANGLTFDDSGLKPAAWSRRSGAQSGRDIPMIGYSGALDIRRPPERLAPLLALGQTMHVGGGAALGLGRYDLV